MPQRDVSKSRKKETISKKSKFSKTNPPYAINTEADTFSNFLYSTTMSIGGTVNGVIDNFLEPSFNKSNKSKNTLARGKKHTKNRSDSVPRLIHKKNRVNSGKNAPRIATILEVDEWRDEINQAAGYSVSARKDVREDMVPIAHASSVTAFEQEAYAQNHEQGAPSKKKKDKSSGITPTTKEMSLSSRQQKKEKASYVLSRDSGAQQFSQGSKSAPLPQKNATSEANLIHDDGVLYSTFNNDGNHQQMHDGKDYAQKREGQIQNLPGSSSDSLTALRNEEDNSGNSDVSATLLLKQQLMKFDKTQRVLNTKYNSYTGTEKQKEHTLSNFAKEEFCMADSTSECITEDDASEISYSSKDTPVSVAIEPFHTSKVEASSEETNYSTSSNLQLASKGIKTDLVLPSRENLGQSQVSEKLLNDLQERLEVAEARAANASEFCVLLGEAETAVANLEEEIDLIQSKKDAEIGSLKENYKKETNAWRNAEHRLIQKVKLLEKGNGEHNLLETTHNNEREEWKRTELKLKERVKKLEKENGLQVLEHKEKLRSLEASFKVSKKQTEILKDHSEAAISKILVQKKNLEQEKNSNIERLEDSLKSLKTNIDNVVKKNEMKESTEIQGLRSAVAALEEEIDEVQSMSKAHVHSLQENNRNKTDELERAGIDLKQRVRALEGEKNIEASSYEEKIRRLETSFKDLKKKETGMLNLISKQKTRLGQVKEENYNIKRQNSEFTLEIDNLMKSLQNSPIVATGRSERNIIGEQELVIENSLEDKQAVSIENQKNLKIDLGARELQILRLQSELNLMTERMEKESKNWKEMLEETKKESLIKANKIAELESEAKVKEQERAQNQTVEMLKETLSEANRYNSQLTPESAYMRSSSSEAEDMSSRVKLLETLVEEYEGVVSHLEHENTVTRKKHLDLIQDLHDEKSVKEMKINPELGGPSRTPEVTNMLEIKELEAKLKESEEEIVALQELLASYRSDMRNLLSTLEEKMRGNKKEKETLQEFIESLKEENEELRNRPLATGNRIAEGNSYVQVHLKNAEKHDVRHFDDRDHRSRLSKDWFKSESTVHVHSSLKKHKYTSSIIEDSQIQATAQNSIQDKKTRWTHNSLSKIN